MIKQTSLYGNDLDSQLDWFVKIESKIKIKIFPLILLYFCAYGAWVYVQDRGSINKKLARTLSLPIWWEI